MKKNPQMVLKKSWILTVPEAEWKRMQAVPQLRWLQFPSHKHKVQLILVNDVSDFKLRF